MSSGSPGLRACCFSPDRRTTRDYAHATGSNTNNREAGGNEITRGEPFGVILHVWLRALPLAESCKKEDGHLLQSARKEHLMMG